MISLTKTQTNIHVLSSMKLFFFSSKSKHCLNDWNQASVFVNNYIYSTQKICIIYKVIGQKSLACEYHACQDINQRKLCRIKQLPCWLLLRLLTSHLILFSEPFCGKTWLSQARCLSALMNLRKIMMRLIKDFLFIL